MTEEVDADQIKRIVKRIKGAIKIRDIIIENDINTWMDTYIIIIHDIISLSKNECFIYDRNMLNALYQELKDDKEISVEDFLNFCDCIEVKKNTPGGHES